MPTWLPIRNGVGLHLVLASAAIFAAVTHSIRAQDSHPLAADNVTSLTNANVTYTEAKTASVTLVRGGIEAIIVDNQAVDSESLPGHRAGYNGLASIRRMDASAPGNLFVPSYAGLNFEHIHDGTQAGLVEKFEPRKFPMELRIVDEFTVELYQPPTKNWQLESCGRYQLLADGVIEYTFECIPREDVFSRGFIGLFWASYIFQPADMSIQFWGKPAEQKAAGAQWLKLLSPEHGVLSTHPSEDSRPIPKIDPDFPLNLVHHPSKHVYSSPWYFGVSGDNAFVQMFRDRDRIWFAQSPSGGGTGNPAWDFQWFVEDYEVDQAYGFTMRAALLPFTSETQVATETYHHREALQRQ